MTRAHNSYGVVSLSLGQLLAGAAPEGRPESESRHMRTFEQPTFQKLRNRGLLRSWDACAQGSEFEPCPQVGGDLSSWIALGSPKQVIGLAGREAHEYTSGFGPLTIRLQQTDFARQLFGGG